MECCCRRCCGKAEKAARELAATAEKVKTDGRIGWLPVLRSQADEVARRAELFERITGGEQEAPEEAGGHPPSPATTPEGSSTDPH